MGRIPWVILLLAVGPVAGQAQMPGIRISALPERPMIERGGGQQYLNFDFSIANTTDSAREIERLELSVFDRAGRLVRRQFLWSMGSASPGIFTVPDRTVPANGALGMFNPFHVLPGDLELGRLRFEFIFSARGLEPLPVRAGLGNYLIIKHRDGEYSTLAHLAGGSVRNKAGDRVRRGDVVARIGFSGDTGLHVHLHYMLTAEPTMNAEGLPVYFDRIRRVQLPAGRGSPAARVLNDVRLDTGDLIAAVR